MALRGHQDEAQGLAGPLVVKKLSEGLRLKYYKILILLLYNLNPKYFCHHPVFTVIFFF